MSEFWEGFWAIVGALAVLALYCALGVDWRRAGREAVRRQNAGVNAAGKRHQLKKQTKKAGK